MAHNHHYNEDMIERLSNHINSINLILDVVDVNVLPSGTALERVIARQLVTLQNRIVKLPDTSSALAAPQAAPAVVAPKHVKFASHAVSAAPPAANRKPSWKEKGWCILNEEGESHNFSINEDNVHFFCIVCERFMECNNLLGHVRGKAHRNKLSAEEDFDEESSYDYDDEEEDSYNEEDIEMMVKEIEDCDKERRIELMWDIVWAMDYNLTNIKTDGKGFYCSQCQIYLNGPLPVVGHVRGTSHKKKLDSC